MAIKKIFMMLAAWLRGLFAADIHYIGGSDTLPPPLKREEELELLKQLSTDGDRVRPILIERNLRLVVYIARKFDNTGVGLEDLVSIGSIGLIKAVKTFNPEKNIKLATYASRCIENEILMHLRKNNNQKSEVSIDEPLNTDWDGSELLLSDVLGTDADIIYKELDDEVDRQLLAQALRKLPAREQEIMRLRFGVTGTVKSKEEKDEYDELTQKEVAGLLGISQSYISRLEKKIVHRLRDEINSL
ncbi:MAG: RNA polymerase sporulation sigma factor SigE [Clostridiales bacterium]|jgi:RNA polymerase sporulation-specific sigma factor|nr:RNA polymerase sporulation sigma factor SigE [Clostridiales bacterium]